MEVVLICALCNVLHPELLFTQEAPTVLLLALGDDALTCQTLRKAKPTKSSQHQEPINC
ncbi:hypothetical protein TorRG33x02_028020 [Trema orientale]|uniref:Uncharacterized protein n=1 Tax=Trema orientale TaxID=63057 RepID=A0A2P5FUN8_TREOI|nr:hypothetical protein TorRG33x02_028020 [Trema orientale]